jgi:quinol monooxygenase YgiN
MLFKVASYRVPAAAHNSFASALLAAIAASKAESGVLGYRGGFDLHDPEIFTITGLYESEDAFNKHLQSSHLTTALATIKQLTGGSGVQFMSAASFECEEATHNVESHVRRLLA